MALNTEKCTCFFGNVYSGTKQFALHIFGFHEGSLPVSYLGLPLVSGGLKFRDCLTLISNICRRIETWTSIFISQAGRLQLIHAILFSMQSYWARFLFLPTLVIKRIQSILAHFLWSGNYEGPCMFKVAWKDCCFPKVEGGLGFKDLKKWNLAATMYQLWKIISMVDSLWVRWVYAFELKRKGFWTMSIPSRCSWTWRAILKHRDMALQFIKSIPGVSSNFLLWHDPWLCNRPLLPRFGPTLMYALESSSLEALSSI